MSMIDFRRTDERDNIRPNPFWVRSAKMGFAGKTGFSTPMDDNESVFMSFPLGGKGAFPIVLHGVIIEILEAFDATPLMAISIGSIPAFQNSDGTTVTTVTANGVAATAVVLPAALGNKSIISLPTDRLIIPADLVTPVLFGALTASGTVTTGSMRVNMLVSEAN